MSDTIALDVDSTLAASVLTAIDLVDEPNRLIYEDIPDWGWPIEQWGEEYLDAIYDAWRSQVDDDNQTIEPMEPGLGRHTDRLRENYNVHIVTHQDDDDRISEGKKEWLDQHGIEYDKFVPVHASKASMADIYDIFIDDKPSLPAEVADDARVFLRDHRYNREAGGQYTRVSGLGPVVRILEDVETDRRLPSGDEMASMVAADVATLLTDSRDTHGDAVAQQQTLAAGWTWYLRAAGFLDDEETLNGSDASRMEAMIKMSRAAEGNADVDHDRDIAGYGSIAGACQVARGDAQLDDLQVHTDD